MSKNSMCNALLKSFSEQKRLLFKEKKLLEEKSDKKDKKITQKPNFQFASEATLLQMPPPTKEELDQPCIKFSTFEAPRESANNLNRIWGMGYTTYKNTIVLFGGMTHSRTNEVIIGQIPSSLRGEDTVIDWQTFKAPKDKSVPWPAPRMNPTLTALGYSGFVFMFGGRSGPGKALGDSWLLHVPTMRWKELTQTDLGISISARYRHAACSLVRTDDENNTSLEVDVFISGGIGEEQKEADPYIISGTPISTDIFVKLAFSIQNTLHEDPASHTTEDVFSNMTVSASQLPSPPSGAVHSHTMCILRGYSSSDVAPHALLVGGVHPSRAPFCFYQQLTPLSSLPAFNLCTSVWKHVEAPPTPRNDHASAIEFASKASIPVGAVPSSRFSHAIAQPTSQTVFMVGGSSRARTTNEVWSLTLNGPLAETVNVSEDISPLLEWSFVGVLPGARLPVRLGCVWGGEKLICLGGGAVVFAFGSVADSPCVGDVRDYFV